eukprot:2292848-Amphidinium_carterae.2
MWVNISDTGGADICWLSFGSCLYRHVAYADGKRWSFRLAVGGLSCVSRPHGRAQPPCHLAQHDMCATLFQG